VKTPTAPPREMTDRLPLLINRDFALLWGGQFISAIGDSTFAITLVLWITLLIARAQPWAPLAVSGALVAEISPELLVAPVAGVFADRWNKRRTMLTMDALRAALVALLVFATCIVPLPWLPGGRLPVLWQLGAIYSIVFLAAACTQFFNPSSLALVASLVAEPDRARASGLRQGASSVAAIIGPSLAALLFFGVGIQWALLLNALSFAASFLAILAIHAPGLPMETAPQQQEGFVSELRAGLRFYFGNRVLVTLLIAGILALLGFGTLNTLGIFFVTQNLRAPAGLYAVLTSAQGVGAVAGAVLVGTLAQRIGVVRIFWGSLVMWGLTILVYARLTTFAPALVLIFLSGFLVTAVQVAETPLFLHVTPPAFIGRAFAVFAPAISAAEVLSIALAGSLDSTTLRHFHATVLGVGVGPVDTIFTATGLCVLGGGIYALVRLRGVSLAQIRAPDADAAEPAP
jgi:MFS family permease